MIVFKCLDIIIDIMSVYGPKLNKHKSLQTKINILKIRGLKFEKLSLWIKMESKQCKEILQPGNNIYINCV